MNKFNDKIWLSKEAARTIVRYLQISYLWCPPSDTGSDEEDLLEIRDLVKILSDIAVAIELDIDLWRKLKHLIDEELEGLFFKEFCDPLLYEGIKARFTDFKILNVENYEV